MPNLPDFGCLLVFHIQKKHPFFARLLFLKRILPYNLYFLKIFTTIFTICSGKVSTTTRYSAYWTKNLIFKEILY